MRTLQFNKVKRVTLVFVRLSKILQIPNVNTSATTATATVAVATESL